VASESARQPLSVSLARAIAGGALVSPLSFLLVSVDSDGNRLSLAYIIGALLALGPFGHAVVTVVHLFLGVLFGAGITATRFVTVVSVVTAGNFVGGLGLVTFAHVMQAIGTERDD
jgi:formate/nitrite transporter FocA (FNT family)